ncbi:MAG: S8 family serine peptidase [Chloroflexi bacterium]|nr:S8 family serine peptidase [Chloroflexota bacterium]
MADKAFFAIDTAALDVSTWQATLEDWSLNGKRVYSLSFTDYLSQVDLQAAAGPTTYEIPLNLAFGGQLRDGTGKPVANTAVTLSLPEHSYSETVVTNENGQVYYERDLAVQLTVSGGEFVALANPLSLPNASSLDFIAAWPGNGAPTPTPTPLPELCVALTTSKDVYMLGEDAQIQGETTDCHGTPIDGVDVTVQSTDPNGSLVVDWSGTSDADGDFTVGHKAAPPRGVYQATANASYAGRTASDSVSYEIDPEVQVELTLLDADAYYIVDVPTDPPVTYHVYRRGNDTVVVEVKVRPVEPLTDPADLRVVVELYKADRYGDLVGSPVGTQEFDVALLDTEVTISPPVEFDLQDTMSVGYYQAKATVFSTDGNSTKMDEDGKDAAVVFNPTTSMVPSFVEADTARFWHDSGAATYNLHPRDGTVFKFAMDGCDGATGEMEAADLLMARTQHLVEWTQNPKTTMDTVAGLGDCDINNTASVQNNNCAFEGRGQCFHYGDFLAAFFRAVGIPGRPVSGGAFGEYVGAKDVDEYPEDAGAPSSSGKLPGDSGYDETEFNQVCWNFHVWSEANIGGSWHVFDANQNFADTQAGYGSEWIDAYCTSSGGLKADKNGGGEEDLDADYGMSIQDAAGISGYGQGSTADSNGVITVQFDAPIFHLGQDLTFQVQATNTSGTLWSGDLVLALSGSPQPDPLSSTSLSPQSVWARSESLTLGPGESTVRQYQVPAGDYSVVGTGTYILEVNALNLTTQASALVVGAVALEIQAPISAPLGQPVTIVATVSNPTPADVHNVRIAGLTPELDEQVVGDLVADANTTLNWTFTPNSAGLKGVSLLALTDDGGSTLESAEIQVQAPPELRIYRLDAPHRVEVGQPFEITAHVWNPGSESLSDVVVGVTLLTPDLVAFDDPAAVTISNLDANSWAEVTWSATALTSGRARAKVSASAGTLTDERRVLTIVAEPGHAVDMIIEGVGDDVKGGTVLAEVPTAVGTNYASAGYEVFVQNEGTSADTFVVSVAPGDGGVAAFDDGETRSVQRVVTLGPGETADLSLSLRTWYDEASARVTVRSQGDLTQWDQMEVRVIRNDARALQVEPTQHDLTIEHDQIGTAIIHVSNDGNETLTSVTLTPYGDIADWISLDQTEIAELPPGHTTSVNVTVAVPKYQAPGLYSGGVRVKSGSQSDVVLINVEVPESHAVLINLSPGSQGVIPGRTGLYTANVQNEGNVTDSYDLTLSDLPESWDVSWSRNPVIVEPGAVADVDLLIIPLRSPDTKPAAHTFTVTASNPHTTDSAQAILEVLPFHDVDLRIDDTTVIPGPPIIITKVWKKAHDQPHGRLDVIIQTHGAPTAANEEILVDYGASIKHRYTLVNAIAANIPAANLLDIASEPFVARIELDEEVTAVEISDAEVDMLNVGGLHSDGYDGTGVVVSIVDTGIDIDHPALPNLAPGYDFVNDDADADDDHGHGTHVGGIVGSNDTSAPGVAPGAVLMPVKVLNAAGTGFSSDVIAGVEWAVNQGAHVINLSLASNSAGDGSSALSQAVDNAVKSGVSVVAAAGNNGPDYQTVGSPGDANLAITVGALETLTTIADFSSRGPTLDGRIKPDLLAPGVDIYSTWVGGGFDTKSGTSMAAPHVVGVVALLLDAYPATPMLINEALVTTATPLPDYDSNTQGNGRVNGDAASIYISEVLAAASAQTMPGDTAEYAYTLTNLGNVADSFSLAFGASDLSETVLAYPTAIPAEWVQLSSSPVALESGAQTADVLQTVVPTDWAGMEITTYRFSLSAASDAEPEVGDTDLAFLSVQPTKRSKIEYARQEIGWLHTPVSESPEPDGLLAKLRVADAKVQKALDRLVAGDLIGTNTSLDATINKIEAFVNEVEDQRGDVLDEATADDFVAKANAIIAHLLEARMTTME